MRLLQLHLLLLIVGAINNVGATSVSVDIDPITFNIEPTEIQAGLTEKTKVITLVHLYGQIPKMLSISEIVEHMILL